MVGNGGVDQNLGKAGCGAFFFFFQNLGVPIFFEWEWVFFVFFRCFYEVLGGFLILYGPRGVWGAQGGEGRGEGGPRGDVGSASCRERE